MLIKQDKKWSKSADVIIVGSARLKGNTLRLVDEALAEAVKLGAHTEKITLSQYRVNPCFGHENCASFESCLHRDDMEWILKKFFDADGVILATPVYYFNVSAQMKAFIDRNYFLHKKDKRSGARVAGIIVVAGPEGIEDTLHTLNHFIDWSCNVNEDRRLVVTGYASRLGDARNNPSLMEEARQLGRQMVESLKRAPWWLHTAPR